MSIDGTKLLLEGFLQKRKDTMKLRWVTYWFRLQNTTLFFYTQKHGSASHLRGYYYIFTVQSVREVQTVDSNRFMFEIIMTNGKRKMLAAETAALRQEWVGCLWQAMNLSSSVVSDSRSTHLEVYEQRERSNSSTRSARPLSAPATSGLIHHETSEETRQQDTLPSCDRLNTPQWSSVLNNPEGEQEGNYDILPLRKKEREISTSTETDEGLYDSPLSYRSAAEQPDPTEESIYDVPSSLLKTPNRILEEQTEDGVYWRI